MNDDKFIPECSGEWISGSGGHRIHSPCNKPAAYWHSDDMHAYCEEHMPDCDRELEWDMKRGDKE